MFQKYELFDQLLFIRSKFWNYSTSMRFGRNLFNCIPFIELLLPPCEDRISNLHESVITHILSRLPTKDAVRTCVLSKSWKYKWTSIDNVTIDKGFINTSSFVNMVERISGCSNIKHFRLSSWNKLDPNLVTALVSSILRRGVESFELLLYNNGLYLCCFQDCASLKILHLKGSGCMLRVPNINNIRNMTSLFLEHVKIWNENSSTDTLILNFPALKTCSFQECKWSKYIKSVEIHAPALTIFESTYYYTYAYDAGVSINIHGARLDEFRIRGRSLDNFVLSSSTIARAAVNILHNPMDTFKLQKLLEELFTAKYLMLPGKLIQLQRDIPFSKYDRLERLDIQGDVNVEVTIVLLHATPFLKFLELDTMWWDDFNYDAVTRVPSCIELYLKKVKCRCISYPSLDQHRFGIERFLLKNGTRLKKLLYIFSNFDLPKDEFTGKLTKFPTASPCVKIEASC